MTEVVLKRDWRDRRAGRAIVPDGAVPHLVDVGLCDQPAEIGTVSPSVTPIRDKAIGSPAERVVIAGFECEHCGQEFRTKAGMQSHLRFKHAEPEVVGVASLG